MAAAGEWTDLEWDAPGRQRALDRLLSGRFARLLLPAIIAQSVLIGGGYATGREVVEFGARFGALGWVAVLAIFLGFTLVSILVFEFARVTRAYDYKTFVRGLLGRAWPLFDVLFGAMAVLVIAVMAAAAGTIMQATLGVPYPLGIGLVIAVVALLMHRGARFIEAFKTVGTLALYLGYAVFGFVVLTAAWPNVVEVFATGDVSHAGEGATVPRVLAIGVLYVGYNLAVYPTVLFALHRQRRRRDSVLAGIVAGLVMTLPFLLTYLAVLAFYASGDVVGAEVPWLFMLEATAGGWVVLLFGLVIGWTLMETSVGLVHAILDRADRDLVRLRLPGSPRGRGLTPLQKGGLAALGLLAAAVLAQVGIMDLVARGYTAMAYGFLLLFALPLATVGMWRIVRVQGGRAGALRRPAAEATGEETRPGLSGRTRGP